MLEVRTRSFSQTPLKNKFLIISEVIPISEHQDTVGPMARSVADAATILSVIAGRDPLDNFTFAQPPIVPDYTKALNPNALKGVRLGVARQFAGRSATVLAAFNASVDIIRGLGATIVDPADFPDFAEIRASGNETIVLDTDFKVRQRASHSTALYLCPLLHLRSMSIAISPAYWTCRLGSRIWQISSRSTLLMPVKSWFLPSGRINLSKPFGPWEDYANGSSLICHYS